MRSHSPNRQRPGFALAMSLLAIVVIGAMVAGGYMAGIQYYRMGRNSLVEQRAMAATELGLDSAYALWSKSWNTQATGTITTLAYSAANGTWVDTVRITKLNQLSSLVVSEGRAGGFSTPLSARRRVAMIVVLNCRQAAAAVVCHGGVEHAEGESGRGPHQQGNGHNRW